MKTKQLKIILLLSLIGLPMLAGAQYAGVQTAPTPITRFEDILRILNTLINWIFTILLIVAVIFIIMAAFAYLGSAGDAEKVQSASNKLIYAAVAVGVGLIAKGVEFVVRQLVGA
jgi:flagellar basal body-associated protein FliL